MSREVRDRFFRLAKAQGYVARSAFKLKELQRKHRIIPTGGCVLDLGCCPGSWLQEMTPPEQHVDERLHIVRADVRQLHPHVLRSLLPPAAQGFAAVLSDMAPSTSGAACSDALQSVHLAENAAALAMEGDAPLLMPGGNLVLKILEGQGMQEFVKDLRPRFQKLVHARPSAVRAESREIYILGLGRR